MICRECALEDEVTDQQVEAAQEAFHQFVLGPTEPLSQREKGITHQAWRYALEAAKEAR